MDCDEQDQQKVNEEMGAIFRKYLAVDSVAAAEAWGKIITDSPMIFQTFHRIVLAQLRQCSC